MTIETYNHYPVVMAAISWMATGLPESLACRRVGIDVGSFKKYIADNPTLQDLLAEADARGSDALADVLLEIDTHGIFGRTDPKMAKVMSDNIKWLLDKRKPKQYGQRVAVDVNLTADKAIINALAQGRQRAALAHAGGVIDASFTEVHEEDEMAALLK